MDLFIETKKQNRNVGKKLIEKLIQGENNSLYGEVKEGQKKY